MNNKKGFTLLELLVVVSIAGIMLGSITPVFLKPARIKAAKNCAEEIQLIQDCALKYYVDNKEWPATAEDMQNEGLLNPDWNGKNVFGNDYSLSSDNTTFTVTVDVPQDVHGAVLARAPEASSLGNSVSSFVSAPGLMDKDKLIHLYAEADELRTMDQEIFVPKIELPDSNYNSDFQTGEGRLKDVYVAKLGKWLSEIRPTVTETEDVVVQTVQHHYPRPLVRRTGGVSRAACVTIEIFPEWYHVHGRGWQRKHWHSQVRVEVGLPSTGPHGGQVTFSNGHAWTSNGSSPCGQGPYGSGWAGIWCPWHMSCWWGGQLWVQANGIETWWE